MFLTGEIIHNPHVNDRLRRKGIQFLSDAGENAAPLGPDDVVVLPAFGVTTAEMQRFTDIGCVMVDTTCGSVLNVWKNVKRYAQDGFTSIIHGKVWHEETQATASQALDLRERPLSRRPESRRDQRGVRLHPPAAAIATRFSRASAMPCRPGSIPTATSSTSAWPTRRRC